MLTPLKVVAAAALLLATVFGSTARAGFVAFNAHELVSEGNIVMRHEGETLIACPMTLVVGYGTGPFEVEGATIGSGLVGNVGTCAGGTSFTPLPSKFVVTSDTLLGRDFLPGRPERVTGWLLNYANLDFLISNGTLRCLYRGTLGYLMEFLWIPEVSRWVDIAIRLLPNAAVALVSTLAGSGRCPERDVTIEGTLRPRVGRLWRPA